MVCCCKNAWLKNQKVFRDKNNTNCRGLLRSEAESSTAPNWVQYLASKRREYRRSWGIRLMKSSSLVLWGQIRLVELISKQLKIYFSIFHSLIKELRLRVLSDDSWWGIRALILSSLTILQVSFNLAFTVTWAKYFLSWELSSRVGEISCLVYVALALGKFGKSNFPIMTSQYLVGK